jgi:hypothetical protein
MGTINFFSDRSLYTQTNVPCVRDKNWAQTVVRGLLHAMADLWPAKLFGWHGSWALKFAKRDIRVTKTTI